MFEKSQSLSDQALVLSSESVSDGLWYSFEHVWPKKFDRFISPFNDGNGARIYVCDEHGNVVDEYGKIIFEHWIKERHDIWCMLPNDFALWFERTKSTAPNKYSDITATNF